MYSHNRTGQGEYGGYRIGLPVIIVLAVITFFLYAFFHFQPDTFAPPPETLSAVIANEQGIWIPELPVRLVIPRIDVDAAVQYVGLAPSGTGEMDIPSNFTDVGWYKEGVRPGMRGSAVIAGHLNGKGVPKAVFYDLDTLEVGDEVVVMSAERVEDIFRVVKVETYDYDEETVEVFLSDDGTARLNLITCGGLWLTEEQRYSQRTVVFTELVTDVE